MNMNREIQKPLAPPKAFLIGVRHKYPPMNGKTKRRQFLRVLARIVRLSKSD